MKLKYLASAFLAFLVCFCSYNVSAQTFDTSTGAPTIVEHNISDDGYTQVNLGFSFPFYGNTYTTSYMHSNGVVQFVNPTTRWCCSGINLDTNSTLSSSYNYAIAVLWTDLIDNSTEGRFYTQGNENYQRYQWNNISEYYNSNRNTVGLEIRPDGSFDMYHQMINIQNHAFTIGVIGDATQGEWTQYQYTNPGGTLYNFGSSTADDRVTGWSATNNVYSYSDGTASASDPCDSDPLYSENCSGYAQAYYNQQCELDALYDSGCSGYADAYFSQQCSLDPLYNEDCSGYAEAYFNQQCSLDPLYNSECPGYTQAYYDQQCSLDPLYDSSCPGYKTAYYNQQCSLDALYDTECPGYATAYYNQQCSLDPLYDTRCPGYEQTVIARNCNIDPLFSPTCDGYAAALAAQQEKQAEETKTAEDEQQVETVAEANPTEETVVVAVTETNKEEITTSVVEVEGIPNVTVVIPEVSQLDTATAAFTARVETLQAETRQEVQQAVTAEQQAVVAEIESEVEQEIEQQIAAEVETNTEEVKEETKEETKEEIKVAAVEEKKEEKKEEPKKKEAKKEKEKPSKEVRIKQAIQERIESLAEKMGESAALETQVAAQASIVAMMGYVPGFKDYTGVQLQDKPFYEQTQIPGGSIQDNRFISRFLMNDQKFNELERSQFNNRVIGTR